MSRKERGGKRWNAERKDVVNGESVTRTEKPEHRTLMVRVGPFSISLAWALD